MDNHTESRIIELEMRLTHQDMTLQTLSDALVRQQRVIERLDGEVLALKQQMQALAQPNIASMGEETPPPHY